jgi:hypothetical protein
MTDQPTEATEPEPTAPEATPPESEPTDKPSREAAKYRTQLREAEAQRDSLAERVTAMQRAEVERLAASKLAKPQGVWTNGAQLADLLDDEGAVDPLKVGEAVAAAVDANGLEQRRSGPIIPGQGKQPSAPAKLNTWEQAFAPPPG